MSPDLPRSGFAALDFKPSDSKIRPLDPAALEISFSPHLIPSFDRIEWTEQTQKVKRDLISEP
ncbi:hypothetical protein COLO4_06163 [Corchorus olitorius]|uniref:Uncharacterized protein n=1 Tax=Corchorus olitorius TaxID=93759 RepID=A0A1R3KNS1_9ROSI|nr:hypothetical protein COLO4_06163 [Corchorus olitorius]